MTIGYTDFGSSRSNITNLTPLRNITHITGNLNIQQNGHLVNLNGLNNLQSIGGNFRVSSNDSLTNLGDFPVLQSIGEEFWVRDNRELTSLGNFPVLQSIGGYFSVGSNYRLTDLGDFPALQTIGRYFYVTNNDTLTSLGNFPALTRIGKGLAFVPGLNNRVINNVSIVVEENIRLSDCYTLTDFLTGGLYPVSGEIYIDNNAVGCSSGDEIKASAPHIIMLTFHTDGDSIAIAYDEVTTQTIMFSIGGGATGWTSDITGDDFITLDTDMNVAQDTGVAITVRATPTDENTGTDERIAVITFTTTGGGPAASATVTIRQAGIPPVYVGDITLINQEQVDTIRNTLGSSTAIRGNLIIGSSIDITDLSPLNFLAKIIGNLEISNNSMLEDVGNFPMLRSIGGYFSVQDNNQLITVGSFQSLETVGGNLNFGDNPKITMIGEYPILRSIGDQFRVVNCEQLQSLNGFPSLTHVGETFFVYRNDSLKIVENFSVLTTIGGNLQIDQNNVLRSIGDFPVLSSVGTDLRIALNPLLDSIGDFPSLTTVKSNVPITENPLLRSIGDFSVLTTIGGNLQIDQNNVLRSIGDFSVLTTIEGDLQIQSNPLLGYCCGFSRILLDESIVSGSTTIRNNAVGCDSESQINTSLTLISSNEIIAYDNTDSIAIDFTLGCGVTGWTSTITYTPTNANFITLSSTGSTTQTGAITIMATPTENMGVERTATITLMTSDGTEADITLTQSGAPGSPTLSVIIPSGYTTVAYTATTTLDSVEIVFTVGNATGWESMISYGDGVDEFVTLSDTVNAAQTDTVKVKAAVTNNEGVERSATITLSTTGQVGFSAATREITIIQRGKPNQAPTDIMLSNNTIVENQPVGSTIGILSTTDPDAGDRHFYSLTTPNDTFLISGDILKTNRILDFESQRNYDIDITVDDGVGGDFSKTFTINIHNERHESGNTNDFHPPTDLYIKSLVPLTTDLDSGSALATFMVSDRDDDDTYTFAIEGATVEDYFIITEDTLKLRRDIDQGTRTLFEHTFEVTVTDSDGETYVEPFTLSVIPPTSTHENSGSENMMFSRINNHQHDLSYDGNRLLTINNNRAEIQEWDGFAWNRAGNSINLGSSVLISTRDFYQSVVIDSAGTRVVMGIGNRGEKNRVRVYDWDPSANEGNGDWISVDTLKSDKNGNFGGHIDLSNDGNYLAVSDLSDGRFLDNQVTVYQWNAVSNNYELLGDTVRVVNSELNIRVRNDISMTSLAINNRGDQLFVGYHEAPGIRFDGRGGIIGVVVVYDLIDGNWQWTQELIGGGNSESQFGNGITLSDDGNRLAVGANNNHRVYIYDWDVVRETWSITATFTEGGRFGTALETIC